MRASSLDVRERVIRAVGQGYSRSEIVNLLGISSATIKRSPNLRRKTGHLHRQPIPGRSPQKRAPLCEGLVARLEAHPDTTLEMYRQLWEQAMGVRMSTSTMSSAIRPSGWTPKKKTIGATEHDKEEQAAWGEQQKEIDATQLVVLIECGSHIGLTPLYARAPRGVRTFSQVPRNRGKNTTVIAALEWSGVGEAMIIEGSTTTVAFERSIEKILRPSLSAGQMVLMGNLAAHTSAKVAEAIQSRGCQVLFLLKYSLDFSPIEEMFSKQRTVLHRMGARTREALQEAIGDVLQMMTTQDAQGWFRHCGYLAQVRRIFPLCQHIRN